MYKNSLYPFSAEAAPVNCHFRNLKLFIFRKMKIFNLLAFVGSAFAEDAGPARLVASKTTESKILAQNVDLTFKYKIFNIGQSDALNVSC